MSLGPRLDFSKISSRSYTSKILLEDFELTSSVSAAVKAANDSRRT